MPCFSGCGKVVESHNKTQRVYCENCRANKKRESARRSAEKIRRAKGIPAVKNESFVCKDCLKVSVRFSVNTVRCKSCQKIFTTLRTREESKKKKTDPARRKKYNEWFREYTKNNPAYAISSHMRGLIHRSIGRCKAGKSWKSFVDYSLEDLMAHLEKQFHDGMTWENRGEWHIDHIVPRSAFNYTSPSDPEFKACWSLTNLRPIWGKENIRKSAKKLFLI